jgi:hypothetical protein
LSFENESIEENPHDDQLKLPIGMSRKEEARIATLKCLEIP